MSAAVRHLHAFAREVRLTAVAGAEVDIWHASTKGFYENQDSAQAEMNLRGKFTTDESP